jgi:glycosyltransferase involved in cell wall biosynthesis
MKNIAFVHDFLLYQGGAENTLSAMSEIFPKAPIFTLLQDENFVQKSFPNQKVESSFLQKAPRFLTKRYRFLFPLMPTAIETFNLRDFDVVISSSSAFAKGIVVKPKTKHFCYMHTPMRYVWDWSYEYLEEQKLKGKTKLFTRFLLSYLRMWDRASAERVDKFIANSKYTAQRIEKYYRKEAEVIYPPVEVKKFHPQEKHDDYFLTVGRLSPYKRTKLIAEVFVKLKLPLVIVGEGKEKEELEKIAKEHENIKVLGFVEDKELIKLYENARAFVAASEDDFNITVVEAMAAGKPTIVLRKGGTAETVIEGKTGEFFDVPQLEILADGVRRFIANEKKYDYLEIRKHAEKFSKEIFKQKMLEFVRKNSQ